jgi:hypothetical protein
MYATPRDKHLATKDNPVCPQPVYDHRSASNTQTGMVVSADSCYIDSKSFQFKAGDTCR